LSKLRSLVEFVIALLVMCAIVVLVVLVASYFGGFPAS
jgi:hypothetical protein